MCFRLGGSRSLICLCVCICECVSKCWHSWGAVPFWIKKKWSKNQGGPFWGNIQYTPLGGCKLYTCYSHILDNIYTRIVWGFQFSSMDHGIVVPGFGGTVSGYHSRSPYNISSFFCPIQQLLRHPLRGKTHRYITDPLPQIKRQALKPSSVDTERDKIWGSAEAWRKWKTSHAERYPSVDAERNDIWDPAEAWRKRGGTTPLGVAVVSFRSVSTLGGKRVRNGNQALCPGLYNLDSWFSP